MTAPGLVGWPQRLTAAPRTAARWARHAPAHTPLRVKLVAALLLLVIAALTGSGVVAAATLRTYLIGRVDTQLASVKTPIAEHQVGQITKQSAPTGGGDNSSFRLPSAYVVAVTDELGALVYGPKSNLVDPRQPLPKLPHIAGARAQTRGTRTFTTDAVHGDDSWRVLAAPVVLADGSNGSLLIAASLREVQNTVDRLTGLFVIIGAVAVVVLAGVGYVVVRASLRPLRDVE
ncbi:MAG: hypothetical protein M3Y06_05185, partial [Actinomycetota bacterium]|nr:hypothetical protein [Actinomycetota bacterium]